MEKNIIRVGLSPNCMCYVGTANDYENLINSDSVKHLFLDLNADVILNSEKFIYAKNKDTLEIYIEALNQS